MVKRQYERLQAEAERRCKQMSPSSAHHIQKSGKNQLTPGKMEPSLPNLSSPIHTGSIQPDVSSLQQVLLQQASIHWEDESTIDTNLSEARKLRYSRSFEAFGNQKRQLAPPLAASNCPTVCRSSELSKDVPVVKVTGEGLKSSGGAKSRPDDLKDTKKEIIVSAKNLEQARIEQVNSTRYDQVMNGPSSNSSSTQAINGSIPEAVCDFENQIDKEFTDVMEERMLARERMEKLRAYFKSKASQRSVTNIRLHGNQEKSANKGVVTQHGGADKSCRPIVYVSQSSSVLPSSKPVPESKNRTPVKSTSVVLILGRQEEDNPAEEDRTRRSISVIRKSPGISREHEKVFQFRIHEEIKLNEIETFRCENSTRPADILTTLSDISISQSPESSKTKPPGISSPSTFSSKGPGKDQMIDHEVISVYHTPDSSPGRLNLRPDTPYRQGLLLHPMDMSFSPHLITIDLDDYQSTIEEQSTSGATDNHGAEETKVERGAIEGFAEPLTFEKSSEVPLLVTTFSSTSPMEVVTSSVVNDNGDATTTEKVDGLTGSARLNPMPPIALSSLIPTSPTSLPPPTAEAEEAARPSNLSVPLMEFFQRLSNEKSSKAEKLVISRDELVKSNIPSLGLGTLGYDLKRSNNTLEEAQVTDGGQERPIHVEEITRESEANDMATESALNSLELTFNPEISNIEGTSLLLTVTQDSNCTDQNNVTMCDVKVAHPLNSGTVLQEMATSASQLSLATSTPISKSVQPPDHISVDMNDAFILQYSQFSAGSVSAAPDTPVVRAADRSSALLPLTETENHPLVSPPGKTTVGLGFGTCQRQKGQNEADDSSCLSSRVREIPLKSSHPSEQPSLPQTEENKTMDVNLFRPRSPQQPEAQAGQPAAPRSVSKSLATNSVSDLQQNLNKRRLLLSIDSWNDQERLLPTSPCSTDYSVDLNSDKCCDSASRKSSAKVCAETVSHSCDNSIPVLATSTAIEMTAAIATTSTSAIEKSISEQSKSSTSEMQLKNIDSGVQIPELNDPKEMATSASLNTAADATSARLTLPISATETVSTRPKLLEIPTIEKYPKEESGIPESRADNTFKRSKPKKLNDSPPSSSSSSSTLPRSSESFSSSGASMPNLAKYQLSNVARADPNHTERSTYYNKRVSAMTAAEFESSKGQRSEKGRLKRVGSAGVKRSGTDRVSLQQQDPERLERLYDDVQQRLQRKLRNIQRQQECKQQQEQQQQQQQQRGCMGEPFQCGHSSKNLCREFKVPSAQDLNPRPAAQDLKSQQSRRPWSAFGSNRLGLFSDLALVANWEGFPLTLLERYAPERFSRMHGSRSSSRDDRCRSYPNRDARF